MSSDLVSWWVSCVVWSSFMVDFLWLCDLVLKYTIDQIKPPSQWGFKLSRKGQILFWPTSPESVQYSFKTARRFRYERKTQSLFKFIVRLTLWPTAVPTYSFLLMHNVTRQTFVAQTHTLRHTYKLSGTWFKGTESSQISIGNESSGVWSR